MGCLKTLGAVTGRLSPVKFNLFVNGKCIYLQLAMSRQQLTERETRDLEQLRNLGLDPFYSYLTQLINQCEGKKTEMHKLKKELKDDKKKANDLKKRGNVNKAAWTSVNCLILTCGTIALFVPGLGWGALAVGAVGGIGTTIGSKVCEKSNKKKTDALIEAVSQKSGNCISVAEMSNRKMKEFEAARARLVGGGSTEEQANVIIILAMIEESFQRSSRLAVRDHGANNLGDYACIGAAGFEVITDSEITAAAASVISKNQGNITEWLAKGVKYVANEVPAHVFKKMCVAFAAVAVTVNIYQLVKTCIKDSEAVVLIEEIGEMLEEGEHSLQFFINVLHCLKEGIQRQINDRDREECNRRIASLTDQMANYTTTIDALQSQITAQNAMIEELRYELRAQIQRQSQAMYSLAYSLQNGVQLPPPELYGSDWAMDQAPRNSIDNFENE